MSTASMPIAALFRKSRRWSIVLSVLLILAGAAAIILPPAAGLAVTILAGWLLAFSGIVHFGYAWHARHRGGVAWEVLIGVLYLATGIYLLWNPILGIAAVTLALAIYLLVEGVLEFVLSFQLRPAPGSGWLLFDGVIALLLAVLIWWMWPIGAFWILGTIVGVSMLISGVVRLMFSLTTRQLVTNEI
jgi:uncharacterized membrane protein HdeD (DUF308 family)